MDLMVSDRQSANPVLEDFDQDDPIIRCLSHGASTLSLRECLSVVLAQKAPGFRGRTAAAGLLETLAPRMPEKEQTRALFASLEAGSGSPFPVLDILTSADQARLLAAFEIGRRYHLYLDESKGSPHSLYPGEIADLALKRVSPHWRNLPVEWLGFIPVFKTRVGGLCVVERGVRTHVNTDPMELFARVLVLRPAMILLFHNHPSGDLTPSSHDFDLTARVEEICLRVGIRLHSHWIVNGSSQRQIIPGGHPG